MSEKPKEPTEQEYNQKMYDGIHAALCANHMTSAVADFLADLAIRVKRIERNEL
jgi:hypothetical protein